MLRASSYTGYLILLKNYRLCKLSQNRLFIYLSPCVPLSFTGEGEIYSKRGFAPLRLSVG